MNKSEQIQIALRSDILEGRLLPDEFLSERVLAARFDVSRIPLREALINLVRDGLVISTSGRGVRIRNFNTRDLQDLYETRQGIEGMAARLAAERMDTSGLERFGEIYHRILRKELSLTAKEMGKLGVEFHQTIVEGSKNTLLINLNRQLSDQLSLSRRLSYERGTPPWVERTAREHLQIFDALKSGFGDAAEKAMRDHIENWDKWL